jgi:hypothetical protein
MLCKKYFVFVMRIIWKFRLPECFQILCCTQTVPKSDSCQIKYLHLYSEYMIHTNVFSMLKLYRFMNTASVSAINYEMFYVLILQQKNVHFCDRSLLTHVQAYLRSCTKSIIVSACNDLNASFMNVINFCYVSTPDKMEGIAEIFLQLMFNSCSGISCAICRSNVQLMYISYNGVLPHRKVFFFVRKTQFICNL